MATIKVKVKPHCPTNTGTRVSWCVGPAGMTQSKELQGNGGFVSFTVPDGCSGQVWAHYREATGTCSRDTEKVQWRNASGDVKLVVGFPSDEPEVQPKKAEPPVKDEGKGEEKKTP